MIELANEASKARIPLTAAAALAGAEMIQNSTRITPTIPRKRPMRKQYDTSLAAASQE
jgi:hypothetical protein